LEDTLWGNMLRKVALAFSLELSFQPASRSLAAT
jgi:hypothetical protein